MTGFLAAGTCDYSSTNNKKGGYLRQQTGGSSCYLARIPLLLCDSSDLQVTESLVHAEVTNNFFWGEVYPIQRAFYSREQDIIQASKECI